MIIHLHVHIKQSDAKNSICQFVLNSFELLRGWASQRTPVLNERDDKTSNCKLITCNSIPNIPKADNLNVHFAVNFEQVSKLVRKTSNSRQML